MFRRGPATSRIAKNVITQPLDISAQPLIVITQPLIVTTQPLIVTTQPLIVITQPLIVITGLDPVICRRMCRTRWPGRGPAMTLRGQ
jgi:hypothetical protein